MNEILTAVNLAEAFSKVRAKLNYTGPLEFNIISKQNPLYKNDKVVIKFNQPGKQNQPIYVQF